MSWLATTLLIVLVAFVACFVLCEWVVRRPRRAGDDDDASPAC